MTMCFCTGACKKPPYRCVANSAPYPWDTTPWEPPYTPWEPPYTPYPQPSIPTGWWCPNCGKVNAPHKDYCDCYIHQGFTLSVSFGDKEKEEW